VTGSQPVLIFILIKLAKNARNINFDAWLICHTSCASSAGSRKSSATIPVKNTE
jgi:hypothetical protein